MKQIWAKAELLHKILCSGRILIEDIIHAHQHVQYKRSNTKVE